MNYSWKIARLGLDDELNNDGVLLENSIVQIHYKRIAADDDGTTSSYVGTCYFSAKSKSRKRRNFLDTIDSPSKQISEAYKLKRAMEVNE